MGTNDERIEAVDEVYPVENPISVLKYNPLTPCTVRWLCLNSNKILNHSMYICGFFFLSVSFKVDKNSFYRYYHLKFSTVTITIKVHL